MAAIYPGFFFKFDSFNVPSLSAINQICRPPGMYMARRDDYPLSPVHTCELRVGSHLKIKVGPSLFGPLASHQEEQGSAYRVAGLPFHFFPATELWDWADCGDGASY